MKVTTTLQLRKTRHSSESSSSVDGSISIIYAQNFRPYTIDEENVNRTLEMEVMAKLLSKSDTTNNRARISDQEIEVFLLPFGRNSIEFDAFDMLNQPWRLKISVRNQGKYLRPWISGQWSTYVLHKGLREGDRVILTMHEQENGVRTYCIKAERKHFGFWYSIDQ
ncbi:unnamed protein product [Dovyalis caffra]|uniref:TF-B3 domain-containing protein n=1 Tax=Dovyalis caffra TaxID=77055 RepID=A0AAV1RPD6_9ROSI|nr:unnamed protein product [Dovyalis caffra]